MSDSADYVVMCFDQQSSRINFVSSDNRLALTAPMGSSVRVPTNPVAWNTLSFQDRKNSVEVSPLPVSHTIPAPLITTWPGGPVESFASAIGFRYHSYIFLKYIVTNPDFQVPQHCPYSHHCSYVAGHQARRTEGNA